MAKQQGKKPTNKDRDKAITNHEAFIRDLAPKYNQLHAQVQDFFAVFSLFVEFLGKDEEFSEFVESKLKEANEKNAEKPKIVGADGKDIAK